VSQQSPCGSLSRAEDKVKLSDDEIEEASTRSATVRRALFTPTENLWAFCRTNRRFEFEKRSQLFIGTHKTRIYINWLRSLPQTFVIIRAIRVYARTTEIR
jgi:hypothetical protein